MTVNSALIFLLGFLLGGFVVRVLVLRAARRFLNPHEWDEQYTAARKAAARHLHVYGTLNVAQLQHLTDAPKRTVHQHLKHMERDGLIRLQKHRDTEGFYTRS